MTRTDRSFRSITSIILKRLVDAGILVYAVLVPVIIFTGGFRTELLGIRISATSPLNPISILVFLILIRLIITTEIKNALLLIGSVFLGLLLMEIGIRFWDPPIAKPGMSQIHCGSPILGWELVPGSFGIGRLGESYRISSAGFRDTEFTLDRKPGTSRIMVVGDSFTFGLGVNLKDTYPKQLEHILSQRGVVCEVINCGVIGYHMWQYNEMLKSKVISYQPDLVVLQLFADDLLGSVPPHQKSAAYEGHNPFEDKGAATVMSYSSLWNFCRNLDVLFKYKNRYRRGRTYLRSIQDRKRELGPSNPENPVYQIMSGRCKKAKYSDFSQALEQFVNRADHAGIQVLIVLIPDAVQLNDSHMQAVNRFVAEVCSEKGIPFVDVTPLLEDEKGYESLYLFPTDAHNSPKGLQLIAESIADHIIQLTLLPI